MSVEDLRARAEQEGDPQAAVRLRVELARLVHPTDPAEAARHLQAAAVELVKASREAGGIPQAPRDELAGAVDELDVLEGRMALRELDVLFAADLGAMARALRATADLVAEEVGGGQAVEATRTTAALLSGPGGADDPCRSLGHEQRVAYFLGAVALCDDARDLGNAALSAALAEQITLEEAWFRAHFPAAGADFIAAVYRELFADHVPELLRELTNAAREHGERLNVLEVGGPDDPEATGHQRALYSVMTKPVPMVTIRLGGHAWPGFLVIAGRLRWLGKMAPSLLAEENQAMFELACRGHAAGFDPQGTTGPAMIRAWVEHMVQRAQAEGP